MLVFLLPLLIISDANSKYLPVDNDERNVKVVGSASLSECQFAVGDAKAGSETKKYRYIPNNDMLFYLPFSQ